MALDPNFLRRLIADKLAERRQRIVVWVLAFISLIFLVGAFYALYIKAPSNFPVRAIISVQGNASLNDIASNLAEQGIIRSPFWFRAAVILFSGEKTVMAGDYFFLKPAGLFDVAFRVTHGNFGLTPVRVTFPEGMTAEQMSMILGAELIDFNATEFLKLAKPLEGYLFPDTYMFPPNAKASQVIGILRDNFEKKMKSIEPSVKAFGKSIKDVVVMASIIEAEARTSETRKTISGILWKRLKLGIPLQVDAPFQYIIGKNTFQLTLADLKYDSPYNTYKYAGLPPGPIGNPGIDSLMASVTPTKTPYLYYLSDIRGNMYYGKTFEEHILNKEKYLR